MIVASRADVAVAACSDIFHGSGEILASPTGIVATIGARLARLTHSPNLLLTDGEATIIGDTPAIDTPSQVAEGALTYRELFELIDGGRRHVIMGAAQLDRHGNQNLSAIGNHDQPIRQLLGTRAAATNTVNHATSYWIARHSPRVFVRQVDFVTGLGTNRAASCSASSARYHNLHHVVTDLGVFDFTGPDGTMAVVTLHPGVDFDTVQSATGFPLHLHGAAAVTRLPTDEEAHLIHDVLDPRNLRDREVPSP